MKKWLLSLTLVSALGLAACSNEAASNTDENTDQADQTEQADNSQAEAGTEAENQEVSEESTATRSDEPAELNYYVTEDEAFVLPKDSADVPEDSQIALLTFDDAPHPAGDTMKIAETLNNHDLKAIFFVNSMYLEGDENEENRQIIKDIYEMGHEIGNHTHTHANLQTVSEEVQKEEIEKTNQIVEEITGERPRFFRAPHGAMTDYAYSVLDSEGNQNMMWTFGYDWMDEYQDANALAEVMVNTELLANGSNLLLHDRTWTADALDDIIVGIEERGFTFIDPAEIDHEGANE